MEKNQNTNKVKLFLFLAVALIVLLVVVSVVEIVNIHFLQKKLNEQQAELNRLYEQHEYYEDVASQFMDGDK